MKRLLKVKLIYVTCLFLLITSGCSFKDIDKRFFVVSIGIDQGNKVRENYLVSLKLAIPSAQLNAGENEFVIIEEEAKTISEALNMMKSKVDKELDYSHTKALIYAEKLVENKVNPQLTYWPIRKREIQKIAYVGIGKPSAKEVLKVKPKSERLPSNTLFLSFSNIGTESPYAITTYLYDFKRRMIERGLDPFLPIIEAKEDLLEINTLGVFNNKNLVLTLSSEETKLFNLLDRDFSETNLKVSEDDLYMVISCDQVRTTFKISEPKNKAPSIEVQVNISGQIEEAINKVKEEDIPVYEKAAEKVLRSEMTSLLKKLQKSKVDPLGFGLRYRSRHFQNKTEWETWKSLYPNIEFKVMTDIHIKGVGIIE